MCRYASYEAVNVEVKGNSIINGDIEISASGSDAKDGFGLALNGGTFNGGIVMDDTAKAAMESTPDLVSVTKMNTVTVDAPEGYAWTKADGEGIQKLAKAVAQIGDTQYASLAEAVAAVPADGRSFRGMYSAPQEITAWMGRSASASFGVMALQSPWWGTLSRSQGAFSHSSQSAPKQSAPSTAVRPA